jgi:GNAT superfamily N-acetyltransferase
LLQSLGVTERLRHSGLGRPLVVAVEEWARSRGATEMCVETWEFEGGPLLFYERLGYRTYERKLNRPLAG